MEDHLAQPPLERGRLPSDPVRTPAGRASSAPAATSSGGERHHRERPDRHGQPDRVLEGLAAYARHPLLRCVGIDRTYYAPLPADAFAEYAAVVPPDFRFLVKAEEVLTIARFPQHPRYGDLQGEENPRFLGRGVREPRGRGARSRGAGRQAGSAGLPVPAAGAVRSRRLRRAAPRLPDPAAAGAALRRRDPHAGVADGIVRPGAGRRRRGALPDGPPVDAVAGAAGGAERGCERAGPGRALDVGGSRRYAAARERYAPFDRVVDPDPASLAAIAALCRETTEDGRPTYVSINNKAEGSAPCPRCAWPARSCAAELTD